MQDYIRLCNGQDLTAAGTRRVELPAGTELPLLQMAPRAPAAKVSVLHNHSQLVSLGNSEVTTARKWSRPCLLRAAAREQKREMFRFSLRGKDWEEGEISEVTDAGALVAALPDAMSRDFQSLRLRGCVRLSACPSF